MSDEDSDVQDSHEEENQLQQSHNPEETISDDEPVRLKSLEDIYASCNVVASISDPNCFEEAVKLQEWKDAMNEEIQCIEKNDTWTLVAPEKNMKIVGLKWIYKSKYNSDGSLNKRKARVVAKGYTQREGVDFNEVYSPIARMETIRLLIAVGAQMRWPLFQLDVKSAFLNGELMEDVFVAQPEGYLVPGREDHVYKLKKALYGLKQAPRAWYSKIDNFFSQLGLIRSKNEPTLYKKEDKAGNILLLSIYVDDIVYMSSSKEMQLEFKEAMMHKFEMSDLGLLSFFLGLEIKQEHESIFVSQRHYAEELLKSQGMLQSKTAPTPMNSNEKLIQSDGSAGADAQLYRKIVGSLLYLTHTRPDIMYATSVVSRFMQQPSVMHQGAVKRILHYIAGSTRLGLEYKCVKNPELIGFSDSDWSGSPDDRRSTTGWVFNLGSAAISWCSKKQEGVALSSTEAEYISVTSAACQAIWMRRMLAEMNLVQTKATTIYCDNTSAIHIAKNPGMHGRTKHIDTKYHFIRGLIGEGKVQLIHCNTNDQVADCLTKPLSIMKHVKFRELCGVKTV